MKTKAFAVIDTNVLVSGSISNGAASVILDYIESQNIIPIFDERMLSEYYDVLNRKEKFDISQQTVYDLLYNVVSNGILINDVEQAKLELKDRKDIPFYEVKESADEFSPNLVTHNMKDFPISHTTVRPDVMLNVMDQLEWWATTGLRPDIDYDAFMNAFINQQLTTSKYTSGKDLLDDMFDTKTQTVNKSSRILRLGAIAFTKTANPEKLDEPTNPYN